MRRYTTLLIVFILASTMGIAPSSAAAPAQASSPIIQGLAGPLGLAVGPGETIYVSQTFAGILTAFQNGNLRTVASSPNEFSSIAGVAVAGRGPATFTVAGYDEANDDYVGLVYTVRPNGKLRLVGDPGTYEETVNPDSINSYGFQGLSAECADMVPAEIGGGYPYNGFVDSNAYAIALKSDGTTYVADAGGNTIVRVGKNGAVSTVAVLPPIPEIVTADAAELFGVPDCAIGATFNFEPVPTDVEIGSDGMLYVTSLPGGPEDDSLGARGSVFKVNPNNGAVTLVASGFLGATDLAIGPDGAIYVAELFGFKISKVLNGVTTTFAEVPFPAAVEWSEGYLYATVDAFGNGSVVRFTP